MSSATDAAVRRIDEEAALRAVVEGTASETGRGFYRALVRNLALALDTHGAWVTEYDEPAEKLRALGFWFGGRFVDGFEYPIAGTPCETAIRNLRLVHIPERTIALYPGAGRMALPDPVPVVSYLGVPLVGPDRRVMGHVAVVDVRPMPPEKRVLALFEIFANRALAEMRRVRLEEELRARQEKLSRLIDGAMDAIVEMDRDLRITMMSAAAEKLFGCGEDTGGEGSPRDGASRTANVAGEGIDFLLGASATAKLRALAGELGRRGSGTYGSRKGSSPSPRAASRSQRRRPSRATRCGANRSTRSSCATWTTAWRRSAGSGRSPPRPTTSARRSPRSTGSTRSWAGARRSSGRCSR